MDLLARSRRPSQPTSRKPDSNVPRSPQSPRTPLLGRSISSQFGSPGSFTREQEDQVIYELGARHISAGFAGESRPRCIHYFRPGDETTPEYHGTHDRLPKRVAARSEDDDEVQTRAWSDGYTLYSCDTRRGSHGIDLIRLRLAVVLRHIQHHYLQLDTTKPRRAILVVPTLLPTPLINTALHCLFDAYAQPPTIQLLTIPVMATVGAGIRNALIVDMGWEETVVSAVGEYKVIGEERSSRAGRRVVWEMNKIISEDAGNVVNRNLEVSFAEAEEILHRMGWVRPMADNSNDSTKYGNVRLPAPGNQDVSDTFTIPFDRLRIPAETILYPDGAHSATFDDGDLPISSLAFKVLLSLPIDLRALCVSRIVVIGGLSNLPGIKHRLLHELELLVQRRGWDRVHSYGSALELRRKTTLARGSSNTQAIHISSDGHSTPRTSSHSKDAAFTINNPTSAEEISQIHPRDRPYDDENDPISARAEKESRKMAKAKAASSHLGFRGIESIGAWAGASMIASLRVEGAKEVERDDFMKNGGWKEPRGRVV